MWQRNGYYYNSGGLWLGDDRGTRVKNIETKVQKKVT